MRSVLILAALVLLLAACQPDDQHFDLSLLHPDHQVAVERAGEQLTRERPDKAMFEFSPDGMSYFEYDWIDANARTYWPYTHGRMLGWKVSLHASWLSMVGPDPFDDACIEHLATHELKHVIGLNHSTNPSDGCPASVVD